MTRFHHLGNKYIISKILDSSFVRKEFHLILKKYIYIHRLDELPRIPSNGDRVTGRTVPATFKIPSPIQSAGLLQFSSWGFHLSCIIMLASVVSAIVNRGRKSNGYMSNSIPSISSVIATIDVNICNIFYNRNLHQRSSLLKKFNFSLRSTFAKKRTRLHPKKERCSR